MYKVVCRHTSELHFRFFLIIIFEKCNFFTTFALRKNFSAMKRIFIIAFMLVALCAQGSVKIKTQHFEVSDSLRLLEKEDPQSMGYKLKTAVVADWPVAINGKPSSALNKYLLDVLYDAKNNRDIFTSYSTDVKAVRNMVGKWAVKTLRTHSMTEEYIVKETGSVPDINYDEEPMRCWYDTSEFKPSHVVGNLMFFTDYNDCYYGGAHNMFFTRYYAFDAALVRPITLKDIVTSPKKLLKILPAYDKRDKDVKWWDNIPVESLENFYIKNGKMVFVFSPYAIGPFCEGEIEVPVSLKTLKAKGLLTTYGKKYIGK